FAAAGQALRAAEMANNLCVTLISQGDFSGALQAVEGTPAIFQRAGEQVRQAQALGNQAAALEGLGRLAQAADLYRQAADLFEQAGDREQRALTLRALSAVQLKQGDLPGALAAMQGGLADEEHPGPVRRVARRLLGLPFKLLGR
ncbi:MAG: tetratricopeptide repeat protein, partial [Chloroflexi bacterium]|nr:tetratricopeptide repeat protein [Chloroflexota bacterium]